MATSLIYKSTPVYQLVMRALYGRHLGSRYRVIADLIAEGASVLDLCCGPPILFRRYLRQRSVRYTGLDINAGFIEQLVSSGGTGQVWDLRKDDALPPADYVIMQGALYDFLPDALPVVERMFAAAYRQVIIAEPVRNLASSRWPWLRWVARHLTDPGSGAQPHRFTEQTLDEFFAVYAKRLDRSFLIPGGREKVYVFNKR
ncbi:MAG TPA: class I SAM-dependent methyltransferase [Blastocatellia bacterium]